jgi:hypothetical protein
MSFLILNNNHSMDPESYRNTFLASQNKTDDAVPVSMNASWEYTRVPCLGILPGLVCPHHDRVQSNGVLRATDFEEMMKRHPGEQGFSFRSFFFFPFFFLQNEKKGHLLWTLFSLVIICVLLTHLAFLFLFFYLDKQ